MNHMTKPHTIPYSEGFKAGLAAALKLCQEELTEDPGSDQRAFDQMAMAQSLADAITARLDVANGLCPHRDYISCAPGVCGLGCACLCHETV